MSIMNEPESSVHSSDLLCLSIRQPWAWLIVNGYKDIENRDWPTRFRGRIYIHAGKAMDRDEYESALYVIASGELPIELPPFSELERGGIVGEAEITDCVRSHNSPWFFGEYGFVLKNQKPLPFVPVKGALGFFRHNK